ncbi:unnamed protein product, partial [Effrenium voratum]
MCSLQWKSNSAALPRHGLYFANVAALLNVSLSIAGFGIASFLLCWNVGLCMARWHFCKIECVGSSGHVSVGIVYVMVREHLSQPLDFEEFLIRRGGQEGGGGFGFGFGFGGGVGCGPGADSEGGQGRRLSAGVGAMLQAAQGGARYPGDLEDLGSCHSEYLAISQRERRLVPLPLRVTSLQPNSPYDVQIFELCTDSAADSAAGTPEQVLWTLPGYWDIHIPPNSGSSYVVEDTMEDH